MIRGMMRFHTRNIGDDVERANQSASLVKFLAEITDTNNSYRFALQSELKHYESADIRNLLFDDLGEVNQPFYLHEFVSRARSHGLEYLSEVNFFDMQVTDFPENAQKMLEQIQDDTVRHQQYIDFIEGRRFHATLLCHSSQKLDRNPSPEKMRNFLFDSKAVREMSSSESDPELVETFSNERGARVMTNNPLAKAALNYLTAKSAKYVSFAELLRRCRSEIESETSEETDAKALAQILLEIFSTGLISIHTRQPKLTTEISERPIASPIARKSARRMLWIPNLRCEVIRIDSEFTPELLSRLDGTRDRVSLCTEMKLWLGSDAAKEVFDEKERAKLMSEVEWAVDENLRLMASKGFLVS
jgi:methyltransferase-like protein